MVVPLRVERMRSEAFKMLKCCDKDDLASGKRSAISPAVKSDLRSSTKICLRAGLANASKISPMAPHISVFRKITNYEGKGNGDFCGIG